MMQTIIVIAIVAIAVIFMARRVYRNLAGKPQAACGCGCSGCSPADRNTCGQDIVNK